jgi:hypothetical protein
MNFCRLTIQEPIFSVSDTEFEGGDDGHGHGDCTFLVKQAQPSHNSFDAFLRGPKRGANRNGRSGIAPSLICQINDWSKKQKKLRGATNQLDKNENKTSG